MVDLIASLGKPLLLTETMSRPTDLLTNVLPAVYGCFNESGSTDLETSVGWFVSELMLAVRVDEFNYDKDAHHIRVIFPARASSGRPGGSFRYQAEQALLRCRAT
jgi:hypothetical protein